MEAGEPAAALDAIAAGLRAAPANEILYRDRMRAHHHAGNTSGIEAAMRELCTALEAWTLALQVGSSVERSRVDAGLGRQTRPPPAIRTLALGGGEPHGAQGSDRSPQETQEDEPWAAVAS